VIALAGLGKVVVKALGGEEVKYPAGSILLVSGGFPKQVGLRDSGSVTTWYEIPTGTELSWNGGKSSLIFNGGFVLQSPEFLISAAQGNRLAIPIPNGAVRLVPGSSWGTFTIACTIPIALFVGLYMYKIRKGRVVEASLIGGALTLVATFLGGWVAEHEIGRMFNLTDTQVVWAMAAYGFIASVLPVWVLLCPRDYLSSFLKIGTIILLVVGTCVANPKLEAPAYNALFSSGGPVVAGKIFPFLFITIMCGAISGFHALVSSGTTPKMIKKESDARTIGYGAMLIEGLVGVVAMIAAATLPVGDYYAMNTDLARVPAFHDKFVQIGANVDHLNVYEDRTKESLRGRTGGAVTLAVGMAHIFDQGTQKIWTGSEATMKALWKYWYHFAIMFEALFILTTIDTGTRIGRFLLQELFGKVSPQWGRADWWPSAILSTALIVAGWAYFINADSFPVIWWMFGIANQMLAVIALAIVSVYLVNEGKAKYLWVTLIPMAVVFTTTSSAAVLMIQGQLSQILNQIANEPAARNYQLLFDSIVRGSLIVGMLAATIIIMVAGAMRIMKATNGLRANTRPEPVVVH
jgi:carbon starvation protein